MIEILITHTSRIVRKTIRSTTEKKIIISRKLYKSSVNGLDIIIEEEVSSTKSKAKIVYS